MEHQIHITIGNGPIRVVSAEIVEVPEFGIPDTVSGKLLDVPLHELVQIKFSENVTAGFKGRRYAFSELEKDGSFQLAKAW